MVKAPNYNHERRERDRLKEAKKKDKLAAKAAKKEQKPSDTNEAEEPK
ncbi:hypothetical protein NGM99_21210 [Mesorhizobium sp. RP14(2022)]|uniref:DUF4169 domain-containing protein n=1 Tax=Mesorhizobium liriopis TaxID=2953882 RepID=A0ABT1CBU5_9HYPH|nr:hypothetical protein [Mesorhizobium liriopis]MCO6052312.1 hypothetical protein [Mesorhizobium liriopis]